MREIIFRAKTLDGKCWIEGNYEKVFSSYMYNDWITFQNDISSTRHAIDPKTLSQYIGIKDKNGKKIFEGDILFASEKETGFYEDRYGIVNIGKFSIDGYYEAYGAYVDWGKDGKAENNYDCFDCCEIVGNIWDNKELLGVE